MKKIVVLVIISFFACNKQIKKEKLVMYKPSEMANLMNKMFEENAKLKEQIKKREGIGSFNSEFLKIHTAKLTDSNDRNKTFNSFALAFIQNQKEIYLKDKKARKRQFNKMVQTCVSCHETSCTGPILRIKKLFIK